MKQRTFKNVGDVLVQYNFRTQFSEKSGYFERRSSENE